MMEPRIQYAKTSDGVNIAYYEMGQGPPLVIASMILWSHLRLMLVPEHLRSGDGLGRGHRVVRYDGRGVGLSDRDTTDFSLDARIKDIGAVVKHLRLDRFAMFAFMNACPGAIAYAAAHPKRITHLILWRPAPGGEAFRRGADRFASTRTAADWELYTTTMANLVTGFVDSSLAGRLARRMRESMTLESLESFLAQNLAIDVSGLLGKIQAQTLVGWAPAVVGGDVAATLEYAREVAAGIADARLFTYRDVTPWSKKATREIEDFLGTPADDDAESEGPARRAADASAFRTILFTDLVHHTEMMSRLGDDRGRAVLREHERITREVLKANGGTEVKTMGDGFMASFGSVTKAVECAVALQRAFAEREGEPLNVRVGLNAGEPIEEDGDLFGATVILTSRIAAKAEGGEILVADTVRGLCSGKGFLFADRGEFVAKGFEEPVRVYEVRWRE